VSENGFCQTTQSEPPPTSGQEKVVLMGLPPGAHCAAAVSALSTLYVAVGVQSKYVWTAAVPMKF
jgi:hypothetical protein